MALSEQLYGLYEEAKLDSLLWSQIRPSGNRQSLPWIVRDLAEVCDLQSILSPLSLDFEAEEMASQAAYEVCQARLGSVAALSLSLYIHMYLFALYCIAWPGAGASRRQDL